MEIWKPVPGYGEIYDASNLGRIRNRNTGHIKVKRKRKDGYMTIGTWRLGKPYPVYVATMVCTAFHGSRPDSDYEVDHENNVSDDDREDNIRWMTKLDNLARRKVARGQAHGISKLTIDQVVSIRADLRTQRAIAEQYGIAQTLVSQIKRREIWRHIE